jgi:hypothetical protein
VLVAMALVFGLAVVVAPEPTGQNGSSTQGVARVDAQAAAAVAAAPPGSPADAARRAKAANEPVEVLSQRTGSSTTMANPDGTFTTTYEAGITRVLRDGRWVDLDPTLTPASTRAKGWRAAGGAGRVFAAKVSATPMFVSAGGGPADSALAGVANTAGEALTLRWPGRLPEPEISGPTATYDVAGPQTVTVTLNGASFDARVVLAARPSESEPVFRFPVTLSGVRLVPDEGGGYEARDGGGEVAFRIPPLVGWDSAEPADPDAGPERVPLPSQLVEAADGGQVLELRPGREFLDSAVYPVTLDPVVIPEVGVGKDTFVKGVSDRLCKGVSREPGATGFAAGREGPL